MAAAHIRFPREARAVIDVTAAPYHADPTGVRDCTATLIRIFNEILSAEQAGMERIRERLLADPDPNAEIGFESRKIGGVPHIVFPEHLPEQRIIYFPHGTYLVSDTLSYTLEGLHNTLGNELNRGLRLVGETRDGVCLKLRDHCPGFGLGAGRPILSFQRGRRSNVAMSNFLENLTIDAGAGNPGAIGVVFFANNTGAVRNVTIRSSDPERRGDTGFAILHELASGLLVQDLTVIGFDFGVRVEPLRMYTVLERVRVEQQRLAGVSIGNAIVSIHGLQSENQGPALVVNGPLAQVVLIDGILRGGNSREAACLLAFGLAHLRNVRVEGYTYAVSYHGRIEPLSGLVDEYATHPGHMLFGGSAPRTLGLAIEATPTVPWAQDETAWISVNACGARGDGVSDDTAAIQRALNSGAAVIYFQPGKYLLDDTVTIPATVSRVNFMFVDLVAGPRLKEKKGGGAFRIEETSGAPLVIEDLFAWEAYHGFQTLVDHACLRTVVLSDLHAQTGALYRNSVPGGKVFIENCCCTIGSRGIAEDKGRYGHVPCFEFVGQQVWARQINPERSHTEIVNRGSQVWILGFKTEGFGSAVVTSDGGATELLGGVLNIGKNKRVPAFDTLDGQISVIAATNGYSNEQCFPVTAREILNGETRELRSTVFPVRFAAQYFIPLYSSAARSDPRPAAPV